MRLDARRSPAVTKSVVRSIDLAPVIVIVLLAEAALANVTLPVPVDALIETV